MPLETPDWLKRIERFIWTPHVSSLPVWKKRAVGLLRLVVVLVRDVIDGELTLWTMSLVYTTLLSMVPLLALSFSVLKAFGVHNQIEPLLGNLLAPLGEQGGEVSSRLVGFIENMNVGVLGAVGLALLIYTVVSLIEKIEASLNAMWHVTQLRSLSERFSRYLSVLLIGPLLIFAAIGITASAMSTRLAQMLISVEPLGSLASTAGQFVPYILVAGAFTFVYLFVPNTRVRFMPALLAGVVAGFLWQSAGWAFAVFVVSSARYSAIYSSFAILVLFLLWLYVSWLVLLIGADMAFYLQHPEYLYAKPGEPRLSNRMRERLALAVVHLMGSHFLRGKPPWTLHGLTHELGIPMHSVSVVVDALEQGGLVKQTNDEPPAYLPARELSEIPVSLVLAIVRAAGEDSFAKLDALKLPTSVHAVVHSVDSAVEAATGSLSVAEMVADCDPTVSNTLRGNRPEEA